MLPDREELRSAYRVCARIVRKHARNFYFTFLTLPRREREAIHAVYAFCRRVDDAADSPGPVSAKRARLEEYRRLFDAASQGRPASPVLLALVDAMEVFSIPASLFHELLDGVTQDLSVTRYPNFATLHQYCYKVASTVGLMCLPIFGATGDAARRHGEDLGIALQLTNILRDIAEDASRDRIYLPQDELAVHGLSEDDLRAGRNSAAFRALMKEQVARARSYYASGRKVLDCVPERTRACPKLMIRVYERILDMIEEADYDVFSKRLGPNKYEKLRMIGRAWKEAVVSSS